MLIKGEGGPADPKSALQLLSQIKDDGVKGYALGAIGNYYRRNGNLHEARSYFEKASQSGEYWSRLALAEMVMKGEGGPTDLDQGLALLDQVKGPAERYALNLLGGHFRRVGNPKRARSYLARASKAGEHWSTITLAEMLFVGEGGIVDTERAQSLLNEAIEGGLEGPALHSLATHFRQIGNARQARAYFEQASRAGYPWASLALADMLVQGEGGPRDRTRGRELLSSLEQDQFKGAYPLLIKLEAESVSDAHVARRLANLLSKAFRADAPVGLQAFTALPENAKATIVQLMLTEHGFYRGRLNGLLTKATLAAVGTFCRTRSLTDCRLEAMPVSLLEALLKNRVVSSPA
jgi:TPR repeat protein